MDFSFEPFPENTPSGKAFLDGWDRYDVDHPGSSVFWIRSTGVGKAMRGTSSP
jgi:hypothetical protein